MARKKTTTTVVTSTGDGDEIAGLAGDAEVAERDPIAELLDMADDDGITYTVTKLSGKIGEAVGYCGKFNRDEITLDAIRDRWGGGKYKIRGTKPNGTFAGGRTVDILGTLTPPVAAVAAATPAPSITELAGFLAAGKGDTNALLLAFIKSQGDMVTALLARPPPVVPPGPSFTEILALIKETRPEKEKGTDAVALLLQGLELGQKLGGGETSLTDIAGKGLEMIAPLIAAKAAEKDAAAQVEPAPR